MPKLVKTRLVISVLGTEPYEGGIEDLADDVMDGDFSGFVFERSYHEISDRTVQEELCAKHGIDIEFFGEEFAEE